MRKPWRISSFEKADDNLFFRFLGEHKILHLFIIYDLKSVKDKTQVWVAHNHNEILGYLFQFDKRIVRTHGNPDSISRLLRYIDLDELTLIIEPNHLSAVQKLFQPIEPTDRASQGNITRYLVMRTDAENFRPLIRHTEKRLGVDNSNEVLNHLGDEYAKRVCESVQSGIACGAYEADTLASVAMVPEIMGNIAFIRGVYTQLEGEKGFQHQPSLLL